MLEHTLNGVETGSLENELVALGARYWVTDGYCSQSGVYYSAEELFSRDLGSSFRDAFGTYLEPCTVSVEIDEDERAALHEFLREVVEKSVENANQYPSDWGFDEELDETELANEIQSAIDFDKLIGWIELGYSLAAAKYKNYSPCLVYSFGQYMDKQINEYFSSIGGVENFEGAEFVLKYSLRKNKIKIKVVEPEDDE